MKGQTHQIDPDSPIPLYHQIAQLLRARIQSGDLAPGDVLEPLREAAAEWQVNFHTVRHAYAELAREGLVEMRGPRGTHVLGEVARAARGKTQAKAVGPDETSPVAVESFLAETLLRAQSDFGLSAAELTNQLAKASAASPKPRAHILECSEHQCQDLGGQIEASWDVEAVPWCLDRDEELPECDLVATHFHYNEIRLRWPERLAEASFVSISPAASLRAEIESRRSDAGDLALTLCERDEPTAEAVAADLSVVLPPHDFPLRIHLLDSSPNSLEEALGAVEGDLLLLPPRIWGALPPRQRNRERLLEIRYHYDPRELADTARRLGWKARS